MEALCLSHTISEKSKVGEDEAVVLLGVDSCKQADVKVVKYDLGLVNQKKTVLMHLHLRNKQIG